MSLEFGIAVQSPGIGTPGFGIGVGLGSSGPSVGGAGAKTGLGAGLGAFFGLELSYVSVLGCVNTPCECN